MNSTESGLLVTAKITAPISSGAIIMMYGNGLSSGRFGPAGTTRLGSSNLGTTRGDRLKSTRGDVGAAARLWPSGTTVMVVSPSVTVSEELSVARVTARPSIRSPFAELVSTISTRSEEHTSELQSLAYLVCRLLLEKKNKTRHEMY